MRRLLRLLAPLALLAACADGRESSTATASSIAAPTTAAPTTTPVVAPPLVGVGMTPRTYEGTGFPDFLAGIDGQTDLLMHAGGWNEAGTAGSPIDVAATLAEQRGLGAVIVLQPSADASVDALSTFLTAHHPAYLGLGNEVNLLASNDPAAFEALVALWQQALPIVREMSPDTKVFVTFQYEWLLGRRDGWFGGAVAEPQWDLLDRFPGADLVGFTTYPSLVFEQPSDLPADYYAQVAQHTDLPVILTEVGWTADETLPLLPGSAAEQTDFIALLSQQATAARIEAMVWTFVHGDLVVDQQFNGMGLFAPDGTARPAWTAWTGLRE
ncbi:MAG TPA: hypothetical protein PLV13_08510 [Ilumatobacteraceae bacterium]|nr:hypothetical protein [Ilumatobacteraceae bacterium]